MVFVDTSFWIALASRRDVHHGEATALLAASEGRLLLSNHVRGETWTWLSRRQGHGNARKFLDSLRGSRIEVVFVSEHLEREALDWLRRHDEYEAA